MEFLGKLMQEISGGNVTTVDSTFPEPVGDTIQRRAKLIFRLPERFRDLVSRYSCSEHWQPGLLYGIVLRLNQFSAYPFQVVFDRGFGGAICSVELAGEACGGVYFVYHDYHDQNYDYLPRTDGDRHVWFGSSTRMETGIAHLYVISYALKVHFVPDLHVAADYDVELYDRILTETGGAAAIASADERNLPEIVLKCIRDAQEVYDKITEEARLRRRKE